MTKRPRNFLDFYICLISSLLLVLALPANANDRQLPGDLVSPQIGVICNEKERFCYDSFGISIGITKDIMGEEAAGKLTRILSAVDENAFDRTNFNPTQGVSCHTLEKACYEYDTISKDISTALFENEVKKYGPDALIGVYWSWGGSRYNNDTEIVAVDSSKYGVAFHADGSLEIHTDCNKVSGGYKAEGKSISITLGPSTLMACPPNSQEQKFLKDLEGVVIWFFEKGTLYLDLKYDTGTMNFYRGMVQ
jgi:heat shock protein HslJ